MNKTREMHKMDLHMHSNFSDGQLTPEQLLALCSTHGLKVVSITDHDTLDHIEASVQAGKKFGIKVIPGCELSVDLTLGNKSESLHLLAYNFDYTDRKLKGRLTRAKEERIERAQAIVNALRKEGFTIEVADVYRVAGEAAVGRPHIAQAVMERTGNAALLQQLAITSIHHMFDKFLGNGKSCYVEGGERFEADQAIKLIHALGGTTVLAHPACHFKEEPGRMAQVIRELASCGLDGIEVFTKQHGRKTTRELHNLARELHLSETAGCDFHRPNDALLGTIGDWQAFGMKPNFPSGF